MEGEQINGICSRASTRLLKLAARCVCASRANDAGLRQVLPRDDRPERRLAELLGRGATARRALPPLAVLAVAGLCLCLCLVGGVGIILRRVLEPG